MEITWNSRWNPPNRREMTNLEESQGIIQLQSLALSFPSLRSAPGLRPWNQEQFEAWVNDQSQIAPEAFDAGDDTPLQASWAGFFIFELVDPVGGYFDVVDAMASWDDTHRQAFLQWARDPFWLS